MVYLPLGPDWTPLEAEGEDAELLTVLVRYGFWWLICLGGSKKTKGWMGVWLVFFFGWLFYGCLVCQRWRLDHLSCFLSSPPGFISSDEIGFVGVYSYHTWKKVPQIEPGMFKKSFLLNVMLYSYYFVSRINCRVVSWEVITMGKA